MCAKPARGGERESGRAALAAMILAGVCVAGLGLGLTGCASPTEVLLPRGGVADRPPLAVVSTAEVGDIVIEAGRLHVYEGLELGNEVTWGDGVLFGRFTIQPGKLSARQRDARFPYYFSDRMTANVGPQGTLPFTGGGLCVERAHPAIVRLFFMAGRCVGDLKSQPVTRPTNVTEVDPLSVHRELIYSGRSGDTVAFLFRERSGPNTAASVAGGALRPEGGRDDRV
jgi:hypothetical protein